MINVVRPALTTAALSIAGFVLSAFPALASGCGGWCPPAATGSVSATVSQSQMVWGSHADMTQSAMIDLSGPDNLRAWAGGEQRLWAAGPGDFGQNQTVTANLQFARPAPAWNPWVWWPSAQNVAVNVGVTVQTLLGWM